MIRRIERSKLIEESLYVSIPSPAASNFHIKIDILDVKVLASLSISIRLCLVMPIADKTEYKNNNSGLREKKSMSCYRYELYK